MLRRPYFPAHAALLAATLGLGCGQSSVTRVLEGRTIEGRFISETAYALYARGADAEARGDLVSAARAFEGAASEDGPNAEIWTRIGAVRCRTEGAARAAEAFDRAAATDPAYEPLHRERARCAIVGGRAAEAVSEAEKALALDPERDEASLVLAEALESAGQGEAALRTLHALVIRRPESVAAEARLYALAVRLKMLALADKSAARLALLGTRGFEGGGLEAASASPTRGADLDAIDVALLVHDDAHADRLAKRARLDAGEFALRAAALGRTALARERAELVIGADPTNATARIAAALAADALGDPASFGRVLSIPSGSTTPSPLAQLLVAELLDRRVGADAARAYLGAESPALAPTDRLYARTAERVRARLAAANPRSAARAP